MLQEDQNNGVGECNKYNSKCNKDKCDKQHCKIDEIIVKKDLHEKLMHDQYVPLIEAALGSNRPEDECKDFMYEICTKHQYFLEKFDTDTENYVVSAIAKTYANSGSQLETVFYYHTELINLLARYNVITSGFVFLQNIENFMWRLSIQDSSAIKSWTDCMELENIGKSNWKLYQLFFLLKTKANNFYDICLEVCFEECNCLVSQIARIIGIGNENITFKKYCLNNYPKEESNISDTRFDREKYSVLWSELRNYVSRRKQKLQMLVDESLHCFPLVLITTCMSFL